MADAERNGVRTPLHRHRLVAWTVLIGLTVMFGVGACQSGSSPSATTCAVPTVAPAGTQAPATAAPGGGGLEVVDHGFTQLGRHDQWVSVGALIRNTSSHIAYQTKVTLRVTDAQGHTAIDPLNAAQFILAIPVIRPGEEVPIGMSGGVLWDTNVSVDPDRVTAFDVVLGSTEWLPARDAASFPAFTTTYQRIERDTGDPESGAVWFSVASPTCRPMVSRGVVAVFYNQAGTVVGGTFDSDNTSPYCASAQYTGWLATLPAIPQNIDEAKTQVASYCDLASPGGDLKPSGAPFN